ncbi:MAG: RagB/SusD family nutrient uptake outer membrane protein [Flavobacteriaceae bacterium]|nr:RagB/SusD family nutrient uptake outer membrane protein [Flavobacteriaceae bacterium]
MASLPSSNDPTRANKNAAHWLLAKIYLNKGVFTAANPAGPYTFDPADMAKVISNVDAITGRSMAADYWDNFLPQNSQSSPEIIFAVENIGGAGNGAVRSRWYMGQHYNQTPGGWNGFTTLAEYYDKFEPNDERILKWIPTTTEKNGYNLGFHIGQQYGPGGPGVGVALKDRPGSPLVFTKEYKLDYKRHFFRNSRYLRCRIQARSCRDFDNPNNDMVIARYGEALLMKAEAQARTGNLASAQTIVQSFKNESTTTIGSVDATA